MDNEGLKIMLNDIEKFVCNGQCKQDMGIGDMCVFGCPFYSLMYKLQDMADKGELANFIGRE